METIIKMTMETSQPRTKKDKVNSHIITNWTKAVSSLNNIKYAIWPKIQIWTVTHPKKFWNIRSNGPSSSTSMCNTPRQATTSRHSRSRCKHVAQTFKNMGSSQMWFPHRKFHKWFTIKWTTRKTKSPFYQDLQRSTPCKIWIREVTKNQQRKKSIFTMKVGKILTIAKYSRLR